MQDTKKAHHVPNHKEQTLLDYWRVIYKYRKSIISIVAVASVAIVIVSLLLTKTYKADALIIPVSAKSKGGLSSLASQFDGLASLAGLNVGGLDDDAAKFIAILKSRTLTADVIKRANLMPILFDADWDSTTGTWKEGSEAPSMAMGINALSGHMKFKEDKRVKTIKVEGVFRDPKVAARVVNIYLDELHKFLKNNAFTMAKRNRMFIEARVAQNKRELLEAAKETNQFYKNNKISNVDATVDVSVVIPRDLDVSGVMVDKPQANLAGLTSLPDQNVRADVEALLLQKDEIDSKIAQANIVKSVPQQVYLTYLTMKNQLLAKVSALLTTQYEMAKIEENREDLAFQVIDKAVAPENRYKPKRAQLCVMVFVASLVGAILLAFVRENISHMRKSAQSHS